MLLMMMIMLASLGNKANLVYNACHYMSSSLVLEMCCCPNAVMKS